MTNPDNVGGLRYTDHNVMNGALCDFATRWRIDGDYIRCGTCDRPQLTSYADNDFPHADFCRVKDSPNMERRPWQTYVELLAPLCRAAPAGGDDQKDYEMDKTIYDLAIHCGAYVDGGEYPDHSTNFAGSPPTIEFTDRQLEKFVEKLLDGSYAYAGFQK